MTTVFTLTGYSSNTRLPDDYMGGELFRPPYVRRDVIYSNSWFGQGNFDDGRAKLKTALLSSRGTVMVVAHSLGARIACSLMDDDEVLEKCPPSRCVFVLGGHPDRKYNGASTVNYSGFVAAYGVNGIPDDCQYRVWDCARQYDLAADYPTDRKNLAAVRNVSSKVHGDYSTVRIGDPRNAVWKDPDNPNVTYVLAPTYPMPTVDERLLGLQRKAIEDALLRPYVEKAYVRDFPAPVTTVNRLLGSNIGYDADKRQYVFLQPSAPFRPFG